MIEAHLSSLPSLIRARSVLREVDYIGDVDFRGHEWLTQTFMPCLRRLGRSDRKDDHLLASVGYYVLGDVHDINRAPRAAIRAYRRCLSLDSQQAAAWREIGGRLYCMGEYLRARNALRKAVRLDPDDDLAVSDLQGAEEELLRPRPPIYVAGDPYWESAELLAIGRYRQALAVLGGKRSIKARQSRARVYGAMRDSASAVKEWKAIAEMDGRIRCENADWFYLKGATWDHPEFWRIMLKVASRCLSSLSPCRHEGLLRDLNSPSQELISPCARYHLARITGDMRTATRLAATYPQWKEVAKVAHLLASASKMGRAVGKPCMTEDVVRPARSKRRGWCPIRGHTVWNR